MEMLELAAELKWCRERITALEAERDRLLYSERLHNEALGTAVQEAELLRAELAECKQDAERYRWLRSNWDRIATSRIYEDGTYYVYSIDMLPFRTPMDLTSLDAAIDAARKGEGEVC